MPAQCDPCLKELDKLCCEIDALCEMLLLNAFVSRRGFAPSQCFPAGSATEVFRLVPAVSEESSRVTAVWEMLQH